MDEDEVLSKITRLLERGCTMLAMHHDCGAPLFRCQGNIVCPICSFESGPFTGEEAPPAGAGRGLEDAGSDLGRVCTAQQHKIAPAPRGEGGRAGRSSEHEAVPRQTMDDPHRSLGDQHLASADLYPALADLRAALHLRLQDLTGALRAEQDLDKLKRLLDCLEGLLRVLRSLPE